MQWRQNATARTARAGALVAVVCAAVTGCAGGEDDAAPTTTTTAATAATTITTTAATAGAGSGFDPESVPLSDAELGEFPYFAIPAGFENPEAPEPIVESDRVPVWTGDRIEWVVGTVHQSPIYATGDTEFSKLALLAAIDAEIGDAGGVRVTDSRIPQEVLDTIDRDVRVSYSSGLGDIYNSDVTTYLVRQTDRRVWVHVTSTSAGGNWMIVSEPIAPGGN
ncbi:Uncharacterised protein [Nocardia otitidiscaviarum]|uniref:Lipoprotein LpqN n=1 Tax=Nocardia otitidiscaviarum TaxID=1823 RepID=A0A378YER0_9NOCA|nr:hypothetical protein [Nocardia otitidiscaviarum]SUA75604.1 Uncharacterised protein [Nocardia otitidiscaviarum]